MKYKIFLTSRFKKDAKKLSAKLKEETQALINKIASGEPLEEKFQDHQLSGKLKEYRDCHVRPDLVLIYKIEEEVLLLSAFRIGSHSEVFG
mgnify:FL=1